MGGKSKNTQYFIILVGLVIFFGLSYLYYTASSDTAFLRKELDVQSEHVMKLKNEILESNVNLEKARSSDSACQVIKTQLERKNEQCSTEQNRFNGQIADLQTSLSEKEESIRVLNQQLSDQKQKLNRDEIQSAAMKDAGVGQATTIIKLNETLEMMKKELALKDDIIHGLKAKFGILEDQDAANPQKNSTSPGVKQEAENVIPLPKRPDEAENVISLPKRPDEPDHLSALQKPTDDGNTKIIPDPAVNLADTTKNIDGGENVIRSPQDRWGMEQVQKEQEDNGEKGPLLDAAENEKF
ncbi:hypothetical protein FO519_001067 [Halicephalobus sp. NKZ332]|nr:hypothetical protein FO519_001067 [Halicephalobus sp. NKZ332]